MQANLINPDLVRLLGDAACVVVEPTSEDFAQRLSHWLDAFGAVGLHAAQRAIGAIPAQRRFRSPAASIADAAGADPAQERSPAHARTRATLQKELQRVHGTLATAIAAIDPHDGDDDPAPGVRARVPAAVATPRFARYRRRCVALQGRMASRIGALRAQVRQVLSQASPRLAQLAELDAALEQAFGEREQKLLATVPALVERRFDALLCAHVPELEASGRQEDPDVLRQPGSWLDTFERDLREILLAELDMRLQPVRGLIEAFSNEIVQ